MTRTVKVHLIQTLRCKGKRGIALIRKVSSAHITMGLVAAALFATVYALETKTFPAPEPSEKPFGAFLQPQSD